MVPKMQYIKNRPKALSESLYKKLLLPEGFKGTFVEKWALYWQGLVHDYREVAVSVVKECYNRPRKAIAYGTGCFALFQLSQQNPDEDVFMRQLRNNSNRLITVSSKLQSATSKQYITMLERSINENKLRFLSLGICSLLWIDQYDTDDCTYPAVCDYTKVSIWNFHKCVIDIGICNQFWRLHWKMYNYDVNYL